MVRNFLLMIMLTSVGIPLVYAAYYNLSLNGLRGEMRVMLTQILTLERVFFLDSGEFVYFENYYGAPIQGVDNCEQPLAAAKLGLVIDWCHENNASIVRYAYKISEKDRKNGFIAIAQSGSDDQGRSFVCPAVGQTDLWHLDDGGQFKFIESCLSSRFY